MWVMVEDVGGIPSVLAWLDGGIVPTEEMQEEEGWVRRGPGKGQVTNEQGSGYVERN